MYKIEENITIEQIKALKPKMIYYSARTCWWTHDPKHLGTTNPDGSGLPCDPRGGVLFQTENVEDWFKSAEDNAKHYGLLGLRAFIAAHHQNCSTNNVTAPNWAPWCFDTWVAYENIIRAQDNNKPANEKEQ